MRIFLALLLISQPVFAKTKTCALYDAREKQIENGQLKTKELPDGRVIVQEYPSIKVIEMAAIVVNCKKDLEEKTDDIAIHFEELGVSIGLARRLGAYLFNACVLTRTKKLLNCP